MTPAELIESLMRHYSKRHASPREQAAWVAEMTSLVRGHGPDVLRRAYETIRDEHDERAFPLPSAIKSAVERSALHLGRSPLKDGSAEHRQWGPSRRWIDPSFERKVAEAQVWQRDAISKYGSWAAYWRNTGGEEARAGKPFAAPIVEVPRDIARAMPLARAATRRFKSNFDNEIDRIAMRALQARSRNAVHLKSGHSLTRRITGERD